MKIQAFLAVLLSLATWASAPTAWADSQDATCEFHVHGDKKQDKSGPCSFSQQQGNVYIDLRNGQSFRLVPDNNKAKQYKDDDGNKVVRTVKDGGAQHVYNWDKNDKKIIVTFK